LRGSGKDEPAEVEVEVVEASPGGDLTRHADPAAVVDALASTYGIPRATLEGFEYYHTGHKLFAVRKAEGAQVSDLPALDVYRVGLYVARIEGSLPHGLRLTMDGAQLWGGECAYWAELDDGSFRAWMRGEEVPLPPAAAMKLPPAPVPWFVVKHRGLPVGCTKKAKDRLLNFVPKERRTL